MLDISTPAEAKAWLADPGRSRACFNGLDLRACDFESVDLCGCVFAGCDLAPAAAAQAAQQGAALVPEVASVPFEVARKGVYRVAELYAGLEPGAPNARQHSFDYAAWRWFMDPETGQPRHLGVGDTLLARTHDTTLEHQLARLIAGLARPVVGIMGGHDTPRTDPLFATVAELARRLTRRNFLILTGGGPGLMEAANLGAFLAPFDDDALADALTILRTAPGTIGRDSRFGADGWIETACQVRARLLGAWYAAEPDGAINLGIPTWFYGHEPPNLFATHSAKLFYNSLREDGLVTTADAGIVFGPGHAGTVQEVFQDANQNYYRPAGTEPTPMILLGRAFWDLPIGDVPDRAGRRKPLAPLLKELAQERGPPAAFGSVVLRTDDPDEIVAMLEKAAAEQAAPRRADLWKRRMC
jgi:predicted Rossmann-fold nucleotide-binding protein